MAIIVKREANGTHVFFGDQRVAIFTPETSAEAVNKFIGLAQNRDIELSILGQAYKEKVEWNHANKGKGKNWPAFTELDKIVKQLCKEAGIIDT